MTNIDECCELKYREEGLNGLGIIVQQISASLSLSHTLTFL